MSVWLEQNASKVSDAKKAALWRSRRSGVPMNCRNSGYIPVCTVHVGVCVLIYIMQCPSRRCSTSLFQHSATDNRAFAKALSLFFLFLKCHGMTAGAMRGRQKRKSPELALTSAQHRDFFLSSGPQYCKHYAHRLPCCSHFLSSSFTVSACLLADFSL